jgi:pyrroloquinoline quinone biosynthesis protein B
MKMLTTFVLPLFIIGCHSPQVLSHDGHTAVLVLGTGQDAGVPQAGAFAHPGWDKPALTRYATCLALITDDAQYLFDCTPDFREQYRLLYEMTGSANIDGIFLTHAHIGHYTGLMFLGRESMGTDSLPVWAMPRMKSFLQTNGPWNLLVELDNIELHDLSSGVAIELETDLSVTPLLVPHRGEFSETVGFIVNGSKQSVLYLPDIDSWHELDATGTRIEDLIAEVDVAYLDATFYSGDELPNVDISKIPHPFITTSLDRFAALSPSERSKIRFLHLNHSNPAQFNHTAEHQAIRSAGMSVADQGEFTLLD